jgi:hypothetical protein
MNFRPKLLLILNIDGLRGGAREPGSAGADKVKDRGKVPLARRGVRD